MNSSKNESQKAAFRLKWPVAKSREVNASQESEQILAATSARVFVVDDHAMFRKAVMDWMRAEENFSVVGDAENAKDALAKLREIEADVAILDISLSGADGLELVKHLHAEHPALKILVLSMHDENVYAMRALRAGAHGYVMKKEPGETLIEALKQVLANEIYVSPSFAKKLIYRAARAGDKGGHDPLERVTDRELEVLRLIGDGQSTRTIAERLSLSVKTVESHRLHLKEKLGLESSTHLVRFAADWISAQSSD